MAWDYAMAILIVLGLIVAGLVALTMLWVTITEWYWWYQKWQNRRWGHEGEQK